jgi:cytochrome d ubiquinol oxidase subunit II
MEASYLALFWAWVICGAIVLYTVLDGFDLGVGVLFGTTREETLRVQMLNTIAPFWDGNETWLVVVGAGFFAAFPLVYAVIFSAFYLPVLLLLIGLIFRGIAFEFRFRAHHERVRRAWDLGFSLGAAVVAFTQGAAVGAWLRGIPVVDGRYAGGAFGWLHPFTILTGIGLVLGYALLGASFLALKNQGELRDWAYRRIRWLAAAVLVVLLLAFTVTFDYSVVARSGLHAPPWGLVFPVIALLALGTILVGVHGRRDEVSFVLTVVFFVASFLTLSVVFWPYMIPYSITIANAAAPDASLQFIFYGAIVVLPVVLAYTVGVYWIFRGKQRKAEAPPDVSALPAQGWERAH